MNMEDYLHWLSDPSKEKKPTEEENSLMIINLFEDLEEFLEPISVKFEK